MIRLVSGTEERLTDSISDLIVTKSFMQNSAGISPLIKRKHPTAISNYVLTLGNDFLLWYIKQNQIFIKFVLRIPKNMFVFTSVVGFSHKEAYISCLLINNHLVMITFFIQKAIALFH